MPRSDPAADVAIGSDVPATAIVANPFASFEGERTVVAAISPTVLRLARGTDLETKKYEAPPELLALARANALERALRRASRAVLPAAHEPGAPSRAPKPPGPPAPRELEMSPSGSWRRLRACVTASVEWLLALWR